jgi:hypothetical protein
MCAGIKAIAADFGAIRAANNLLCAKATVIALRQRGLSLQDFSHFTQLTGLLTKTRILVSRKVGRDGHGLIPWEQDEPSPTGMEPVRVVKNQLALRDKAGSPKAGTAAQKSLMARLATPGFAAHGFNVTGNA